MIQNLTPATILLLVVLPILPNCTVGQESAASPAAADSQIEAWVKQLDSDSYAERQGAMIQLRQSGVVGIEALAKIARGSNPEVTSRAITLLTALYSSTDPDVAIAADEALESLAEKGPPMAVVRTQEALSTTLGPQRRRHAIAAIKRLGGHVIPGVKWDDEGLNEVEMDLDEEGTVQHVVLGKNWKGGLNGIKYLARIPELRSLNLTTAVPLTVEEQSKLKEKLPMVVRIEVRGSAFMGIKSMIQDPDICLIDTVVPNSPAKKGGLKSGDIITHVDGLPIQGFSGPTGLTGALQSKQGGETVYLEVVRRDEAQQKAEMLEITVVLGEW